MAYTRLHLILFTAFNIFFFSNAAIYKGTPTTTVDLRAVLKQSLELKCEYTGVDGDGQFAEWYKNNGTPISGEISGHYVVKTTEKESKLIIKIFVRDDANVNNWYVKTNKNGNELPKECQFGQIALKASPQGIVTNREKEKLDAAEMSIRRVEGEEVSLKCLVEPKNETENRYYPVSWQYSKDGKTYAGLPDDLTSEGDIIKIKQVKKFHRGFYRCILNDVSFTVLLRVKDRLAALWPFIGIVGVVLVLIIIILIFEKRQKTTRKTPIADEDENDHANDPLVRTSDHETKKRAVRA